MAEQEKFVEAPKSTEQRMNEAFAEALKAEGIVKEEPKAPEAPPPTEAKTEAPPPEAKPEEPKTEESGPFIKHFEKLAKEREAFRKEAEVVKPYMEMLKSVPPHSLQALARAMQSGDPMALLAAGGYSYADVANRVVSGEKPPAPQKTEEPAPTGNLPPEIREKLQRLDQVEQYVAQQQRREMTQSIKAAIPEKLKFVKGLEATDMVMSFLTDFHTRTGTMPGETFEESVAVAAEAVEQHLAQQAQRWSKVLTPVQPGGTVPSEASAKAPQTGSASVPVPKTLTNNTAAPAPVKPEPRTRQEQIDSLLKDPEFMNNL